MLFRARLCQTPNLTQAEKGDFKDNFCLTADMVDVHMEHIMRTEREAVLTMLNLYTGADGSCCSRLPAFAEPPVPGRGATAELLL